MPYFITIVKIYQNDNCMVIVMRIVWHLCFALFTIVKIYQNLELHGYCNENCTTSTTGVHTDSRKINQNGRKSL